MADPSSANVAWLIQQAMEKGIKAILVKHQILFRRTHNLPELGLLLPADYALTSRHGELRELYRLGIESRYPEGEIEALEDFSPDEVQMAMRLARELIPLLIQEF